METDIWLRGKECILSFERTEVQLTTGMLHCFQPPFHIQSDGITPASIDTCIYVHMTTQKYIHIMKNESLKQKTSLKIW